MSVTVTEASDDGSALSGSAFAGNGGASVPPSASGSPPVVGDAVVSSAEDDEGAADDGGGQRRSQAGAEAHGAILAAPRPLAGGRAGGMYCFSRPRQNEPPSSS